MAMSTATSQLGWKPGTQCGNPAQSQGWDAPLLPAAHTSRMPASTAGWKIALVAAMLGSPEPVNVLCAFPEPTEPLMILTCWAAKSLKVVLLLVHRVDPAPVQ